MTKRDELIEDQSEDPVLWIRRIRDQNAKQFKTTREYFEYLATIPWPEKSQTTGKRARTSKSGRPRQVEKART